MRYTTDLEISKAAMLKAMRTAIRLKHSIDADREIAEKLPVLEGRINHAVAMGESFEFDAGSVFDEVGNVQ